MLYFWKTCLELYILNIRFDEDVMWGTAKTSSSDKKCKGNINKNGCVEVSKEGIHNNDETKYPEDNFVDKNIFNTIISILMVHLI